MKVKACDQFKYLKSLINATGTCEEEIENKISMGKRATRTLHGLFWNRNISLTTKHSIYKSIIKILYESKWDKKLKPLNLTTSGGI